MRRSNHKAELPIQLKDPVSVDLEFTEEELTAPIKEQIKRLRQSAAAPDTAAIPLGRCTMCGWETFEDITHSCPTGPRPLVVFNRVGTPRVHSSGNNYEDRSHVIDERYS